MTLIIIIISNIIMYMCITFGMLIIPHSDYQYFYLLLIVSTIIIISNLLLISPFNFHNIIVVYMIICINH